ncbi:hypothetical protein [Pontibacter lucknowensis]|uniref:Fibronectin type-III domain-containing protein n=1 Tax=Pontibacter lucknowensis TaxID=1077936 RepID=A0A1N6WIJ7_9BACT|nr:hypothetical protein [Pontibacter lucknowensis]SIQ89905.1 hypothetical protein SAMN05421545_1565 [Pontibacter lucknowensis]
MKQLLRLLLGIIPCFFLACDYSPSGSHFEEVNPHVDVVGDIQLDNFPEQDTLMLRGSVNLQFNVSLPGRTIYSVELLLDKKSLGTATSATGQRQLQTTDFADGYYKLQLNVVGNSGTGSLADKAGAEGVQVYRTWVVYIDNTIPKPVTLTSVKAEDGSLKVEWKKYRGTGFQKYEIMRQYPGQQFTSVVVATITDPNQTTWFDTDYLGERVSYNVVTRVNGYYYNLYSNSIPYFYPKPQVLSSTISPAKELIITFSSTPFYRNLGSYELTLNSNRVFTMTNSKDTVVTTPANIFGEELHATLFTYPKSFPGASSRYEVDYAILSGLGAPWGPLSVEGLFGMPASGKLYFTDRGYLKVVDAATRHVEQQRNIMYLQADSEKQDVISQDGKILYSIIGNAVHRLHPLTLQTLASYELNDLLPEELYHFSMLDGVSNNNRLILRARNAEYYEDTKDHAYVIDMEQQKVVTAIEAHLSYSYSMISPDGKIISAADQVYVEQSNGSWKKLSLTKQEANTLTFHRASPLFFTTKGTTISFYSTTDGTLQSTLETERELYMPDTDPFTGHLYGSNSNQVFIYNSSTGQLVNKLEVAFGTPVFLYNNTLYSGNRYLKL